MRGLDRRGSVLLLFLVDLRVVYRLPLSVLSSDRIRPRLSITGNHDPGRGERLPFEFGRILVGVVVNLPPRHRVLVGTRATVNGRFNGIVLSVELRGVLDMCYATLRIDTVIDHLDPTLGDLNLCRAAFHGKIRWIERGFRQVRSPRAA